MHASMQHHSIWQKGRLSLHMTDSGKQTLRTLIQTSNPAAFLAAAAAHMLGASAAAYLGDPIRWDLFGWSLLFVLSLHLITHWIPASLHPPAGSYLLLKKPPPQTDAARRMLLHASFITVAFLGTALAGFLLSGGIPLISWLALGALLAFSLLYSFYPRLRTSGAGEIWQALIIAVLIPGFSFSLMTGELHRLIPMSTTALAAFWFSGTIVAQLKTYAKDTIREQHNLTTRFGWRRAMFLHDAGLEFAVFTMILAYLFGYPTRISASLLIVLPLVITQIIHMRRIRRGGPPRLRLMEWTAAAIFFLTIYLQIIGFLSY